MAMRAWRSGAREGLGELQVLVVVSMGLLSGPIESMRVVAVWDVLRVLTCRRS
jgi:hypothetical protein